MALSVLASAVLSPAVFPSAIPCVWDGVDKIVAVGDLHGDYDNFVEILKGTGIVDENLKWAGGKTHFVQTGDVMDRGPGAKAIFDLIRRLEKEAGEAGGMVHFLLGNHEEMNMTGIAFDYPDYITVDQFVSFLAPEYRKKKEHEFLFNAARSTRKDRIAGTTEKFQEYWREAMKTEESRQAYMDGFEKGYKAWLLEKNAVIRINDTIFVHGGISEKYSAWKLEDINTALRTELEMFWGRRKALTRIEGAFEPKIVYDSNGPLWYRELATRGEKGLREEFLRILDNLHAGHMVIAHTIYRGNGMSPVISPVFMSRFDQRLWIIDTGISRYYGGINSALLIDQGSFVLWTDNDAVAPAVEPRAPEEPNGTPSENIEDFLRNAKIGTIVRGALWGRTAPWTIFLLDGNVSRKAVFKYIDRPRPSPLADSYRYELAAYALSRLLGLDLVPPTVEREIEGVKGSLQFFLEGAVSEAAGKKKGVEPKDPANFRRSLDTLKIFVVLANDDCDNPEDTYIDPGTWRVYRVDFSQAFGPSSELGPGCEVKEAPDGLLERLQKLDDGILGETMSRFLNKDEIAALVARKDLLIRRLKGLIR